MAPAGMCSTIGDVRLSVGPSCVSGFGVVASRTTASFSTRSQKEPQSGRILSIRSLIAALDGCPTGDEPGGIDGSASWSWDDQSMSGRSATYMNPM